MSLLKKEVISYRSKYISITRDAKLIESRLVLDKPLADYATTGSVFRTIYIVSWDGNPRLLFGSNVETYNTIISDGSTNDFDIDRILLNK
jgi:hypothetical protein